METVNANRPIGEALGFTQRHIDCCFPDLNRLAAQGAPKWMTDQLDEAFMIETCGFRMVFYVFCRISSIGPLGGPSPGMTWTLWKQSMKRKAGALISAGSR